MKSSEYYQTAIPPKDRPDGRDASDEVVRLRLATRALRLHLDDLPIDYNDGPGPDRFLAGISFNFARQRYACADSLIGAGMGGVVLGAITRSVLVDGLKWRWVAQAPEVRRGLLLGELLNERNNICEAITASNLQVRNLARWLMPIPPISDLTGESRTWLNAAQFPTDDELLEDFLNAVDDVAGSGSPDDPMHLLDAAGMRGAVLVLAFAGHGNFLGLQSCLTEDGAPGHDLRDVYEALFMHVAAVGVVSVLHGTAAAVPESWPSEVKQEAFIARAVELAATVTEAARPIHRLIARRPRRYSGKPAHPRPATRSPSPRVVVSSREVAPFAGSLKHTVDSAEKYWTYSRRSPVRRAHLRGKIMLHEVLNYGGAYSNLEATLATYDKAGSGPISAFAARMLLEEAARLHWRFSVSEEAFASRATQYFDEFRARRNRTVKKLIGNGVAKSDAERLFELPSNVVTPPPKPPAKNRTPIPTTASLLREFGRATQPRDPGWIGLAYSLLSQVTHATTLGALHTVRFGADSQWHINELTPEMIALSLDVTCIASAYLIGHSALILTDIDQSGVDFRAGLRIEASKVHAAARLVHGLG